MTGSEGLRITSVQGGLKSSAFFVRGSEVNPPFLLTNCGCPIYPG